MTLSDELRSRVKAQLDGFERKDFALEGRRAAAVTLTFVDDTRGNACFILTSVLVFVDCYNE